MYYEPTHNCSWHFVFFPTALVSQRGYSSEQPHPLWSWFMISMNFSVVHQIRGNVKVIFSSASVQKSSAIVLSNHNCLHSCCTCFIQNLLLSGLQIVLFHPLWQTVRGLIRICFQIGTFQRKNGSIYSSTEKYFFQNLSGLVCMSTMVFFIWN